MAIKTWTGESGSTSNWSDPSNWGGSAAISGDDLIFRGTSRTSPVNDYIAGSIFRSITFDTSAINFVLTGSAITISGGSSAIVNNAVSGTVTFGIPTTFSSNAPTINNAAAGSTLLISGTLNNGGLSLTATTSGPTIVGTIQGSGGLIKAGTNTLTINSQCSYGGNTFVNAGTLLIENNSGIYEGLVNATTNFDTTTPVPQTTQVRAARWGDSNNTGGTNIYPAWKTNCTWGYKGYFYAPNTQTYYFGKNFDDSGLIKIDGTTIISHTVWNSYPSASASLSGGWHSLELRFGQGTGGVGPQVANYGRHGLAWSPDNSTWYPFADPGNGSVLSTNMSSAPTNILPIDTDVTVASGATLDLNGIPQQLSGIQGDGSIINSEPIIGLGAIPLTISGGNNDVFYGTIPDATNGGIIRLVLNTPNKITLQGYNTFTGGSTVVSGGIVFANSCALGAGSVTVNFPGVLSISGTSGAPGILAKYFSLPGSLLPNPNTYFNSLSALQDLLSPRAPDLAYITNTMNMATDGSLFPQPFTLNGTLQSNFNAYYTFILSVPTTGLYTFNTSSDDGSMIWINNTIVVNNNAFQGVTTKTGTYTLTANILYNVIIAFFQGSGGLGLIARMSGPNNTTMANLDVGNPLFTISSLDLWVKSISGNGNIVVNTGNLIVDSSSNSTFSGTISGPRGLEVNGYPATTRPARGVLTLNGINTYTGDTNIDIGTLHIIDGGSIGSENTNTNVFIGNRNSTTTATLTYNINNPLTQYSSIVGNGNLIKTGSGTLTLPSNPNGGSGYFGGTLISNGTINSGGAGLGTGLVSIAPGASLNLNGISGVAGLYTTANSETTPATSYDNWGTWFGNQTKYQGNVSTTMNLGTDGSLFPYVFNRANWGDNVLSSIYAFKLIVKTSGTYTFRLGSDDGSVMWINGVTVVNNNFGQAYAKLTGTIVLAASVVYDVVISYNNSGLYYGFTCEMSDANNTNYVYIATSNSNATIYPDLFVGAISGAGTISLNNANLWLGNMSDYNFTGTISGSGGLRKWASGSQTLSGICTYTGTTEIWGGELLVNTALSSGKISVHNGILAGIGPIGGAIQTTSYGIVAPGAVFGAASASLPISSDVTFGTNGLYSVDISGASLYDNLNIVGNLNLNGGSFTLNSVANTTSGDVYTIAKASTAVSGTFNSMPDGFIFSKSNRKFRINYNSKNVILTDIGGMSIGASGSNMMPFLFNP